MKKLLCIIFSTLIILSSFSACSKDNNNNEKDTTTVSTAAADNTAEENNAPPKPVAPEDIAKNYLYATYSSDGASAIVYDVFDSAIMKQAYADKAAFAGLSEEEYYTELCKELNLDLSETQEPADFNDYEGYTKYIYDINKAENDEEAAEIFGSDYKLSINIVGTEETTVSGDNDLFELFDATIKDFEEEYHTDVPFSSEDAEKFLLVKYHYTIEGSEYSFNSEDMSDDAHPLELILVQIGGEWKVYLFLN